MNVPNNDLLSWTFGNRDGYDQDRPILVDAARPWRYLSGHQAAEEVRAFIRGLRERGLETGDVVCIHAFNDILYPVLVLAIIGAGGVFTGTNPAYTADELTHHFNLTRPRFIVTEHDFYQTVRQAAESNAIPSDSLFVLDGIGRSLDPDFQSINELRACPGQDWIQFDDEKRSTETPVGLFSTSGTTGLPKVAIRTHRNFVNENVVLNDSKSKTYVVRRLLSLPMFHAFAAPLAIVGPLREGQTTYIMRRFVMGDYLNAIADFGITETIAAPPMLQSFLELPPQSQAKLSGLKTVICAGAPLSASVQSKARRLLSPDGRLVQCWGMTEAGWITSFQYPEDDDTGSIGRLLPNCEAKLIGTDGEDITDRSSSGEICVRGPSLMPGYYKDPKATRGTMHQTTWLRTGDIGYVRDGKLYITDRAKDLIKVRGWQVAPAEVESVLVSHGMIKDAAVFGIPGVMCEKVRCHVVPASLDQTLDETEIRNFLLQHLAKYKVQGCEIRIVDQIPRSISGKILKKQLREEVLTERLLAVYHPQTSWVGKSCVTL
ncbi:amp dependent CoA ligase [Saccharata proteae CBS 121410]|uniref:Amp dependent CoA ligase n=1 Tax=Saccharata proteae CBS 121410 TaxID=1314787 RepID=A0A9P4HXG8_9PEZI|nr:amp dependent CoA ligase [Saccharata proteae CBS 121410]